MKHFIIFEYKIQILSSTLFSYNIQIHLFILSLYISSYSLIIFYSIFILHPFDLSLLIHHYISITTSTSLHYIISIYHSSSNHHYLPITSFQGCKQPNYGPHESNIIMTHIDALLKNDWIEECEGPWGSLIVLAPKPHQEHITNIEDFNWRMCVSYRNLNAVTKPFTYPIPRCDNAISSLGPIVYGDDILFISLDAKQGYHQILVKQSDREKLAFFAPNGVKYTFKVMPFGPTNAPSFYTCMMHQLQKDWELLFYNKISEMATSDSNIIISSTNQIHVNGKLLIIGSKVIIDDILSYSNNIDFLLIYVDCICAVFIKFRVSFQLKKCDFLKDRVEYVGHDLTAQGNCPAESKFDLIKNWPLPSWGPSLHSFIGLINFYHQYIPFFEITLKPLRALERQYRRKNIPASAWTQELQSLFQDFKELIISSPLLARYDPTKPTFLKTDWSAYGMGWILCQPDDSPLSLKAITKLQSTGECDFDLTMKGPRLRPIAFGSRACLNTEQHFHSFVGEIACGRWAIAQNKKFLWGSHFYWLCDCSSVKEILNYNGSVHMLSRWAMELLGYNFSIVHRPARMMSDVDALNRRYEPHYQRYLYVAALLHHFDKKDRPLAFQPSAFPTQPVNITPTTSTIRRLPIFTTSTIELTPIIISTDLYSASTTLSSNDSSTSPFFLQTLPVAPLVPAITSSSNVKSPTNHHTDILKCLEWHTISWLCVDDILQSFSFSAANIPSQTWSVHNIFTHSSSATIMNNLHNGQAYFPTTCEVFLQLPSNQSFCSTLLGCDFNYIPYSNTNFNTWFQSSLTTIERISSLCPNFSYVRLWLSGLSTNENFNISNCINTALQLLPTHWTIVPHSINPTSYNCPISYTIYCFTITTNTPDTTAFHTLPSTTLTDTLDLGFTKYLFDSTATTTPTPYDNHTIPIPSQIATCHTPLPSSNDQPNILANICFQPTESSQSLYNTVILDPYYPALPPSSTCNDIHNHSRNFHVASWNDTGEI